MTLKRYKEIKQYLINAKYYLETCKYLKDWEIESLKINIEHNEKLIQGEQKWTN